MEHYLNFFKKEDELVFSDWERAQKVAQMLLEENYIVMFSKEEELTVLHCIWTPEGDITNIVFQEREIFEEELGNLLEQEARNRKC